MPRPKKDTVQVSFRIPAAWLDRADKLAPFLGDLLPGSSLERTDVLRAAIARGFDSLEKELELDERAERMTEPAEAGTRGIRALTDLHLDILERIRPEGSGLATSRDRIERALSKEGKPTKGVGRVLNDLRAAKWIDRTAAGYFRTELGESMRSEK
jgi:hypothetical protein